jgi:hypothetical protein
MESPAVLHHQETPSRRLGVGRLFSEGLLDPTDPAVAPLRTARTIPESLWKVLRTVDPVSHTRRPVAAIGAPPLNDTRVRSWAISFVDADGQVAPFDLDPELTPGLQLPVPLIARTLDHLGKEGWRVLNLSEDRGVNDDASESFVLRQRYLLHRALAKQ